MAKPLNGKQTEYVIAGERGLKLLIMPSGTASYMFRYDVFHGAKRVQRKVMLGNRDDVKLSDATAAASDLRREIAKGADPVAERDERSKSITLRQMFEERLRRDDRRTASTMIGYRLALENDIFPELGNIPALEVTSEQIARVLDKVEDRSKSQAHKARTALGGTFRWAIQRRLGGLRVNPVQGLGYTFQNKPRTRVLTDHELGTLWHGLDIATGMSESMRIVLKLAVLTGQRIGQIVGARISELTGLDESGPMWRLPAERMKRKDREQILPLSSDAAALFRRAIVVGGEKTKETGFVFPAHEVRVRLSTASRTPRVPHINRESTSRAMDRLCQKIGADFIVAYPGATPVPLDDFVTHDLRKLVTTRLRELHHTPHDVCDLILHHAPRGVTGSHYDFAILEGPVRKAMEQWAEHVRRVISTPAEIGTAVAGFAVEV